MKSFKKNEQSKLLEYKNKSLVELNEILHRQSKLLQNKQFISKLKDKGEKLISSQKMIEQIVKEKQAVEETESLLSKLTLGEKIILPKHPLFTSSTKINSKTQSTDANETTDIVRKLMDEELDIFSIAISKTFDEQLSKQRSERFVLNRPCKTAQGHIRLNNETQPNDQSMKKDVDQTKADENKENLKESGETENKSKQQMTNKRESALDKYKGSALECLPDLNKFHQLSIDESLELCKGIKFKEFELMRQNFLKRLGWRQVTQFDSDSDELCDLEESETDSNSD